MSDTLSKTDEIFRYIFLCDLKNVTEHLRRNPSAIRAKVNTDSKDMQSPLHFACQVTNSTEIIDALLTNGAGIDEMSKSGSALCIAAWNGKSKLVRHLLRRGARIGLAGQDGYNDLHRAAVRGHSETCKVLLEHGADINCQHPITGDSALSYAAAGGHHKTLLSLLLLAANINNRAWTGFTPLAVACQNSHLANVVSLLQAGADASLPDKQGAPPIHKAAQRDNVSVLRVLLEHGCDKDQVEKMKLSSKTTILFESVILFPG